MIISTCPPDIRSDGEVLVDKNVRVRGRGFTSGVLDEAEQFGWNKGMLFVEGMSVWMSETGYGMTATLHWALTRKE